MIIAPLFMCTHPDGYIHPVQPYPEGTSIFVDKLGELGPQWYDPADPEVLVFAPDCRYLICEYAADLNSFLLSRLPV